MKFVEATTAQVVSANAGAYEWSTKPRHVRAYNKVIRPLAAPYMPAEDDPRRFFIDLSQFNIIDLIILAMYVPVKFWGGMIRIGGSASVRDTRFKFYWDLLENLKLLRMIYTYNWPGWTVDAHIRNFMASITLWTPDSFGDSIIWVDTECHAERSKREVSNHTRDYIFGLKRETGMEIGDYSAPWFTDSRMEFQDWMEEIWWWIARWFYPDQQREHPGPVIMPFASNGRIKQEKCMFQQTGSRGDASAFGGTGAFDTDRFYLSDAVFKQLFPTGGNGTLPGECPEECIELIQSLSDMLTATNHKVLNLEQQLALIAPILEKYGEQINKVDDRTTNLEVILKAIAEVINKGE